MRSAALQQAIYDRLTGYAPVSDAVTGIYTSAPQEALSEDSTAFPFLTVEIVTASPMDTKSSNGIDALFDVHIWSRTQSALSWRSIADDIYDALQKYDALNVVGANVIDCRFDSGASYMDPEDGRTWHSVQTFRVTYFDE